MLMGRKVELLEEVIDRGESRGLGGGGWGLCGLVGTYDGPVGGFEDLGKNGVAVVEVGGAAVLLL